MAADVRQSSQRGPKALDNQKRNKRRRCGGFDELAAKAKDALKAAKVLEEVAK